MKSLEEIRLIKGKGYRHEEVDDFVSTSKGLIKLLTEDRDDAVRQLSVERAHSKDLEERCMELEEKMGKNNILSFDSENLSSSVAEDIIADAERKARGILKSAEQKRVEADIVLEKSINEAQEIVDEAEMSAKDYVFLQQQNMNSAHIAVESANKKASEIIAAAKKEAEKLTGGQSVSAKEAEEIISEAKKEAERIVLEAKENASSMATVIPETKNTFDEAKLSIKAKIREASRSLLEARDISERLMSEARLAAKSHCKSIDDKVEEANNILIEAKIEANHLLRDANSEAKDLVLREKSSLSLSKDLFRDIRTTNTDDYRASLTIKIDTANNLLNEAKKKAEKLMAEARISARDHKRAVEQQEKEANDILKEGKELAYQKLVEAVSDVDNYMITAKNTLTEAKELYKEVLETSTSGKKFINEIGRGTRDIEEYVVQYIRDLEEKEEDCSSLIMMAGEDNSHESHGFI